MSDVTEDVTEYLFENMGFEDLRYKGNLLLEEKNYSEANRYFTKALERNPDHWSAWTNKAIAQMVLGEYRQAIESYTKAIERDLKYVQRAYCYWELGEHKQAIKDYTKAIELNPKNTQLYYDRGSSYQPLGEYE